MTILKLTKNQRTQKIL